MCGWNAAGSAADPVITKADILKVDGTMLLGVAAGDESIDVRIAGDRKSVLPRHTGILGTTGGGKSTTVSRLIGEAARDNYAVILLDTEGEYTEINEPTIDPTMLAALEARGQQPEGVAATRIYTLVGKDTSNPGHPDVVEFTLQFSAMSPFVVEELLDLSDAQKQRFEKAYDTCKLVLQDLGIFPRRGNDEDMKASIELDEFDTGYPHMRLANLYDVIHLIHARVGKEDPDEVYLRSPEFRSDKQKILQRIDVAAAATSNVLSWRALLGKVSRLMRLSVFDHADAKPLTYDELLKPGQVSIFDLSDTDSRF